MRFFILIVTETILKHFCSLSYRELKDFRKPLLLNFPDPYQQNFVMLDYNFFVQVITVGCDNVINNIPDQDTGGFVKPSQYQDSSSIAQEYLNIVQRMNNPGENSSILFAGHIDDENGN
jgi:hypothetical protein